MVKICVSGSKGKMGSRIIALAKEDPELEVGAEFDVGTDPKPLIESCDCLVEFTTPEATLAHLGRHPGGGLRFHAGTVAAAASGGVRLSDGETIEADAVVVAVPAWEAGRILPAPLTVL